MQQTILFFIFTVGCATKPLEEGTVDADPIVTDPLDNVDADGSGSTSGSDDGGGTTGSVNDTGDDGGEDDSGESGDDSLDCDQAIEMSLFEAPEGTAECVVQPRLECDAEPIVATNDRGLSQFDSSEYTSWYCFPFEEDPYAGPEAVFAFEHPGTGTVYIDLHTPCEELSLIAVRWNDWEDDRVCPTEDTVSLQCDAAYERGDERLRIDEFAPINYLLMVDGPRGEIGNFTLSAEC